MVNARAQKPFSQRGNALMVSLVFLVILTTLALSVAGTGRLELMMAANTQFDNQAYQAAESGIDSVLRINPEVLKLTSRPGSLPTERSYFFNPTTSAGGFDDPTTPAPTRYAEQARTKTTYQKKRIYSCTGEGNTLTTEEGGLAPHEATIDSWSKSQRGGRAHHQQGFCFTAASG